MPFMELTKTYKISEQSFSTSLQEEVVILHYEQGKYYSLENIGILIWETLQKNPSTMAELSEIVMQQYEIDEATCQKDILAFLKDLENEKLIKST